MHMHMRWPPKVFRSERWDPWLSDSRTASRPIGFPGPHGARRATAARSATVWRSRRCPPARSRCASRASRPVRRSSTRGRRWRPSWPAPRTASSTMSSAEAVAAVFDIETGLQELVARGYQCVHPADERGEVLAVVGVRVHDDVVDVVRLNAEDDVVATRMPGTEDNIFEPERWLWRRRGEGAQVLTEILSLPDAC